MKHANSKNWHATDEYRVTGGMTELDKHLGFFCVRYNRVRSFLHTLVLAYAAAPQCGRRGVLVHWILTALMLSRLMTSYIQVVWFHFGSPQFQPSYRHLRVQW